MNALTTSLQNLSSIYTTANYGVTKNQMRDHLMNSFNFTSHLPRKLLATYFTRVWEVSYFKTLAIQGVINHEGNDYQIVYNNCTRFAVLNAVEVKLSFREAIPEFNLPAYVLVKPMPIKGSK